MTVIATCGHEIDIIGEAASWMEYEEDHDLDEIARVVSYGVLCTACYKKYKEWGILLETEQAKRDWLDGKTEYPNARP